MSIFHRVKEMFRNQLDIDEDKIKITSRMREDLGIDSLEGIELMMHVEEAFGIEVDDDAAKNWLVVGDIVQYLEKLGVEI